MDTVEQTKDHTRKKIRVRVERTNRWWRWKVAAAVVLALLMLGACLTIVPHLLSSLISDGGESQPAADSSAHP